MHSRVVYFALPCLLSICSTGVGRDDVAGENAFFNGKDLTGWKGLNQFWSIKDGALVGSTFPDGGKFNTFLCSERKYKDFELHFLVRLLDRSKGRTANSGVQIRSEIIDQERFVVKGPQCDMGQIYWGSLYGERFGGMMQQAPKEIVTEVLKESDFNDYYIRVEGKHVTIKLNGKTTVDRDFDNLPAEGIIAWQLHAGPPMEATFKDIKFKDLTSK
jgi:hypothetical protein